MILLSNTHTHVGEKWQILQCLTIQGANSAVDSNSTAGVSRAMVKDRFKTFNTLFEEIHQRQSQWTVPDSELRESLRLAVAEVLLPAYRSFLRRFGYVLTSSIFNDRYAFGHKFGSGS